MTDEEKTERRSARLRAYHKFIEVATPDERRGAFMLSLLRLNERFANKEDHDADDS